MRRKICISFFLFALIASFPLSSYAAGNWYYGSGNYVSSAPVKPTTGLKFYVDYSAITTYGSGAFTAAFDWNGDYKGNVAAVAMYPASSSSYPGYFLISTKTMLITTKGETFYYTSSGTLISDTYPMDSTSIYKCEIRLNSDKSAFNVNGSFDSTYLKKTIRHEVGHVFLLKHPSNFYFSSVMHQGVPNGSIIAETITYDDKDNIIAKWGL
ncbi:MAG TPA: hypothetical protein VF260_05235 [Bacilli bacterium]